MVDDKAPSITQTPEFQEAVRVAAAKAVAEALALARDNAGTLAQSGDVDIVQALAMSIADMADQGVGRRNRVPPDVLRARKEARDLMVNLIIAARATGHMPSYRLTNKVLLDNMLVDPVWIDANHTAQPTEIDWPGVPNEAMVPINDTAREIFKAFQDSIGTIPKKEDQDALLSLPLGVTPMGLVVKGGAATGKRSLQQRVDGRMKDENDAGGEGLKLRHREAAGRYKPVNILGTIAKPAQQSI
jgi:hypothetical protein